MARQSSRWMLCRPLLRPTEISAGETTRIAPISLAGSAHRPRSTRRPPSSVMIRRFRRAMTWFEKPAGLASSTGCRPSLRNTLRIPPKCGVVTIATSARPSPSRSTMSSTRWPGPAPGTKRPPPTGGALREGTGWRAHRAGHMRTLSGRGWLGGARPADSSGQAARRASLLPSSSSAGVAERPRRRSGHGTGGNAYGPRRAAEAGGSKQLAGQGQPGLARALRRPLASDHAARQGPRVRWFA